MGKQIIKQPNGKYCLFSSVIDDITDYDLEDAEEIVETLLDDHRTSIANSVFCILEKLENGEKPYHQGTLTYEEMLERVRDIHGDEFVNEIKELIETD